MGRATLTRSVCRSPVLLRLPINRVRFLSQRQLGHQRVGSAVHLAVSGAQSMAVPPSATTRVDRVAALPHGSTVQLERQPGTRMRISAAGCPTAAVSIRRWYREQEGSD